MTTTLSTQPKYPVPKRTTQVTFHVDSPATYVRVWCVDAPRDSELRKKLDETRALAPIRHSGA